MTPADMRYNHAWMTTQELIGTGPLTDLSLCVLMLLVAYGCGRIALRLMKFRSFSGRLEYALLSLALGGIVFSLTALVLGVSGSLTPPAALLSLVALSLAGCYGLCSARVEAGIAGTPPGGRQPLSLFSFAAGTVFLSFAGLNLLAALVPTLNNDTLNLYFWCPKVWIRQNSLVDLKAHFVDNIIFWVPLMHAYCMLLSSEVLAKLFNVYGPGVLAALVVFSQARRYFKAEIALLATAIFYGGYFIVWLNESGRINLAMGFYELTAMYCLFSWVDADGRPATNWLMLSAACAGFAAGIHISSWKTVLTIAVLFVAVSLWQRRYSLWAGALRLAAFLAVVALAASPLYVRNYVTTGNPVFPLCHSIFGGERYTGLDSTDILGRGQRKQGPADFVCKLWEITTRPYPKTRSHTPCPLILIFAPLFIFVKNAHRRVVHFLGVAALLYVGWFFTQRMARYGFDYLSLLSIVAAYTICAFIDSRRKVLAAATVCVVAAVFVMDMKKDIRYIHPTPVVMKCALGLLPRRDYLVRESATRPMSPGYRFCEYINARTPPSAVVFGTTEVEEYWFDRPYLSVREAAGMDIITAKTPEEMLHRMRERHITHVLYNRRYIDTINKWLEASGVSTGEFLPRKNLFEDPVFRAGFLATLLDGDGGVLYEVRYSPPERYEPPERAKTWWLRMIPFLRGGGGG